MKGQHTVENSAGTDASHVGKTDFENGAAGKLRTQVGCTDECDTSPTIVSTLHFGGDCTVTLVCGYGNLDNFPEYTAGDYSVKYVCSDANSGDVRTARKHQQCRKIQNVDLRVRQRLQVRVLHRLPQVLRRRASDTDQHRPPPTASTRPCLCTAIRSATAVARPTAPSTPQRLRRQRLRRQR